MVDVQVMLTGMKTVSKVNKDVFTYARQRSSALERTCLILRQDGEQSR
jgi:hypothetical protein